MKQQCWGTLRWGTLQRALTLVFFLPAISLAQAPTTIAIDLTKSTFKWSWTQGTGGPVDEFRVKCGPTAGQYTIVVPVKDSTARSFPVNKVITESGTYFCIVTASNQFGESGASNELTFSAGTAPVSPIDFGIGA